MNHSHDLLRNIVLLSDTFGHRVRDVVVAEIGSDVNLMDDKLLAKLQAAEADVMTGLSSYHCWILSSTEHGQIGSASALMVSTSLRSKYCLD